jgi:hypothetical protein
VGHRSADAVERQVEIQQGSLAERHFVEESVEDRQADAAVKERLGGVDPERFLDDDEPPRA